MEFHFIICCKRVRNCIKQSSNNNNLQNHNKIKLQFSLTDVICSISFLSYWFNILNIFVQFQYNLLTRIYYIVSIIFVTQAREGACQKYINQYNFHYKSYSQFGVDCKKKQAKKNWTGSFSRSTLSLLYTHFMHSIYIFLWNALFHSLYKCTRILDMKPYVR